MTLGLRIDVGFQTALPLSLEVLIDNAIRAPTDCVLLALARSRFRRRVGRDPAWRCRLKVMAGAEARPETG